jgi:hypothetical protein
LARRIFKLIPRRIKKTGKYLILLIVLITAGWISIKSTQKYKSFEAKIEDVGSESYWVRDEFLPSLPIELRYKVQRIVVRTKKGKILVLAIYDSDIDRKSIGKSMKGTYRPGNLLEIKGENVILGFIDMPGPKIRLNGEPDGVIKKYRIMP